MKSEIPEKFWNVVLEKDGDDLLDRSCEKWRSIIMSQRREDYPTINKKKEGWLDWLRLAYEMSCKTRYWRKDRGEDGSDGEARKKK
jgi:hypothetical protein